MLGKHAGWVYQLIPSKKIKAGSKQYDQILLMNSSLFWETYDC
jgi:hypothetical protein